MLKKTLSLFLSLVIILSAVAAVYPVIAKSGDVAGENVFNDISDAEWKESGVAFCYSRGYMVGTGKGAFSPADTVSRAMIVTVLSRMAGADLSGYKTSSFKDVPAGKWYSAAVQWAFEKEYTHGVGRDIFGPSLPVTREMLAAFLYNFTVKQGKDVSTDATLDNYSDASSVSGWAAESVRWAAAADLIGENGKELKPKSVCSRLETAKIIEKYFGFIEAEFIPVSDMSGGYKSYGRTYTTGKGLAVLSSADRFDFNANCFGKVTVRIYAETTESSGDTDVYFTGYVDGERCEERYSVKGDGTHEIVLANSLPAGKHSFSLVRQTEWNHGDIYVAGVEFAGQLDAAPADKPLYIEFIGDSLTTGFDNLKHDPASGDWGGEPVYQDATQAYPFMTAEKLNADISVIAIQGIGCACGFQPMLMGDIYYTYPRVLENDCSYDEEREPDYVVINLFANDYDTYKDKGLTRIQIVDAARQFLLMIREEHPNAKIIFSPPRFGSLMYDLIIELGSEENGYYFFDIPLNSPTAGDHPDVAGHKVGAEELYQFILEIENNDY